MVDVGNLSDTILNAYEELVNLCNDTRPRVIKRKIRYGKKYKYQKIIVYNFFHDVLSSNLRFSMMGMRKLINAKGADRI